MEGFVPGSECALCQGRCCKEKGCSLSPKDMLRTLQERNRLRQIDEGNLRNLLLELLKENEIQPLYAIDYFTTENGPLFYLRMRHKCYTFIGVDAMGECCALTPEGCSLSEEKRPKGGRFLKSTPDKQCIQHYSREMMIDDWTPYQDVLSSIWKEFEPKFRENGTFDRCDAEYFKWMRIQREGK